MPSNAIFDPMFSTVAMSEAVSGESVLRAMLDVEAALASATAAAGLIPRASADEIRRSCSNARLDAAEIGRLAAASGNPVVPVLAALRGQLPAAVAGDLHRGATSQDILDTALMLVARRALDLIVGDIDRSAEALAAMADRHRSTPMVARTLGQQAIPTVFGFKAAGWLVSLLEARAALSTWRRDRLALQLGGAAGTLASLGTSGPVVQEALATELRLSLPVLPWHTLRARIAELAAALGLAAGAAGKAALDISLMAQTEVAEIQEPAGAGQGRSSAMPHKRNPVHSVAVLASARRAHALVPIFFGAMLQEHERATGGWQAEWAPLLELFELTGACAANLATLIQGMRVDTGAMRRNLEATGGLVMAESVAALLAIRLPAGAARALVDAAVERAIREGLDFREALAADVTITSAVPETDLDFALDPGNYMGAAEGFIDRALAYWEIIRGSRA